MQPGVRAVVFDVVGTLVEPFPPVAEAYRDVGRHHGVERSVGELRARFRDAWQRQEVIDAADPTPYATSRARERERWKSVVADVFGGDPASDAIFQDLWDHFGRAGAWRALPEGTQLVGEAKRAGLVVALASNFDERLLEIARSVEPLVQADHVFASSEIGWRKPAVEFFRRIEERLGLGPADLMIVGDDPKLDIAAGRRAGWHVYPVGRQSL